jgi:hypothetical protein
MSEQPDLAPTTAPTSPQAAPAPATRGSALGRAVLGLIIAALVALVSAVTALSLYEVGGLAGLRAMSQGQEAPASLAAQLDEARAQLAALQAAAERDTADQSNQSALQAADLKALTSQLDALKSDLARLDQQLGMQEQALDLSLEAVQPKLAQSQSQAERALTLAQEASDQTQELASLIDPDQALSGQIKETLSRLEGRLDQVAAQAEQAQAAAAAAEASLDSERLTQRQDQLAGQMEAQIASLQDLEQQLSDLADAQGQTAERAQSLRQELQGQLADLSAQIDPAYRENRDDGLRLLALSRLRGALAQTGGFDAELAALQGLAVGKPKLTALLAPLKAQAAHSAPALDSLTAQTDALWRDLSSLARSDAAANQGVLGSMLGKVSGLVTIEPVDAQGQETLAGWLADAKAALTVAPGGRPDYALAWDKLGRIPSDLTQRSQLYQDWFAKLSQRRARDQAAWDLEAWALSEKLGQP